ncbi:MAG: ParB/RepB/Spo0J family partition protein, partial [Clostridia bacterium]|nr:ParB/RepB/Spo0J family partition protein [Clostridia bacterium]
MAKKGLGKGLDALFAEEIRPDGVIELKLTEVMPNKDQPRERFDEEALLALSDSIKEYGVIQPIVVIKTQKGYKIVAGERRWRAAKKAGLKTIPAVIRDYDDRAVKEVALVENLQREDLNPLEIAEGYRSLMDEYGLTQEEISARLGKSRSSVANSLRLLSLDDFSKEALLSGRITEGHARCALTLPNGPVREFFINRIIDQCLNVRQAELFAKELLGAPSHKKDKPD